jgi:hypothetical protein
MLRTLRVIQTKVRFIPAPCFFTMQSTSETIVRPASSTKRSYAPQNLPVYDYDLVVVGGGSGGKKKKQY